MINKHKKIWAHYEQLKTILGIFITLFFVVPFVSLSLSCLIHSKEIDAGIEGAVKSALIIGLKWYSIIMPIIIVLFIIGFLFYSDTVEFTETSIKYYRWMFTKRSRTIPYVEITECVISNGLWWHKGKYVRGRKIIFFNKNSIILWIELYYKACLSIALILKEKIVRLVGENSNLKTIDDYFKIDFMNLRYEEQLKILKYYCKFPPVKYETGEEIIKKK